MLNQAGYRTKLAGCRPLYIHLLFDTFPRRKWYCLRVQRDNERPLLFDNTLETVHYDSKVME